MSVAHLLPSSCRWASLVAAAEQMSNAMTYRHPTHVLGRISVPPEHRLPGPNHGIPSLAFICVSP
jgi:hypothetical protein